MTLLQVWRNKVGDSLLGRLRVPTDSCLYKVAHPTLLDGIIQLCLYVKFLEHMDKEKFEPFVPAEISRVQVLSNKAFTTGVSEVWAVVHCVKNEKRSLVCNVSVFDPVTGMVVMQIVGVKFALFPVAPAKVGVFQRKWRHSKHLSVAESSSAGLSVSVVGPGWDSLVAGTLDCFASAGLACSHVGSSIDMQMWEQTDVVLVPLFSHVVNGITGVQTLVVTLLELINRLSALHRQSLMKNRNPRIVLVAAHDTTVGADSTSDGSFVGAVLGLIRAARLELSSSLSLTWIGSDEDLISMQGLSTLASQVFNEVVHGNETESEVLYLKGERLVCRVQACIPDISTTTSGRIEGLALVTGGLGGLGIVTAEALVEAGARTVVLVSRSGAVKYADQGLESRLEVLSRSGAKVILESCDVSDEGQVVALLERVRSTHGPLRAIVHAAGLLADGLMSSQTAESVGRVWGPKANGAWFLHKHTLQDKELGVFILYSALASLFGNIGQTNYSAANAYLDDLARYRVSQALPALSVQWPAVSGVGMAAAMDERFRTSAEFSIPVGMVKRVVKHLLGVGVMEDPVQAVLSESTLKGSLSPQLDVLMEEVIIEEGLEAKDMESDNAKGNSIARSGSVVSKQSKWQSMGVGDIRRAILVEVTSTVKSLLGDASADNLDPTSPLMEMGLDSLASTQLIQQLGMSLGVRLRSTLLFRYPTIEELTNHLVDLVNSSNKALVETNQSTQNNDAKPQPKPAMKLEVRDFAVSNEFGRIEWPGLTDISGLDISKIVNIQQSVVSVYKGFDSYPSPGNELNKTAIVTLFNVRPNKKRSNPKSFEKHLRANNENAGATFVSYDEESGAWCFQVEHFSSYGLMDIGDDSDESRNRS